MAGKTSKNSVFRSAVGCFIDCGKAKSLNLLKLSVTYKFRKRASC